MLHATLGSTYRKANLPELVNAFLERSTYKNLKELMAGMNKLYAGASNVNSLEKADTGDFTFQGIGEVDIITIDGENPIYGCTDPTALNYDANANANDGSCTYLQPEGCTDPTAFNYDPNAVVDDGSCCYNAGCTDSNACNFDEGVCFDDGSCCGSAPGDCGCTDPAAYNYDVNAECDDGSCIYTLLGCTDPNAYNYNSSANTDDGSCVYVGCTNSSATNYNPLATIDDGSCYWAIAQNQIPEK